MLRNKANVNDAKNYLQLLLNQKMYYVNLRVSWYENLALLYQENVKDNMQVMLIIILIFVVKILKLENNIKYINLSWVYKNCPT